VLTIGLVTAAAGLSTVGLVTAGSSTVGLKQLCVNMFSLTSRGGHKRT
jgi:hypothetical protein